MLVVQPKTVIDFTYLVNDIVVTSVIEQTGRDPWLNDTSGHRMQVIDYEIVLPQEQANRQD